MGANRVANASDFNARAEGAWTLAQKGVLAVCLFQLAWSLAGFIAEPSFDFGDGAATASVLGVDFNGVHALSGLLLFGPGLVFSTRPAWALLYAIAASGALFVTGIWALASMHPAYVFSFPNNERDAVLHLATAALLALIATVQLRRDRAAL